jgi:hypothetical protein
MKCNNMRYVISLVRWLAVLLHLASLIAPRIEAQEIGVRDVIVHSFEQTAALPDWPLIVGAMRTLDGKLITVMAQQQSPGHLEFTYALHVFDPFTSSMRVVPFQMLDGNSGYEISIAPNGTVQIGDQFIDPETGSFEIRCDFSWDWEVSSDERLDIDECRDLSSDECHNNGLSCLYFIRSRMSEDCVPETTNCYSFTPELDTPFWLPTSGSQTLERQVVNVNDGALHVMSFDQTGTFRWHSQVQLETYGLDVSSNVCQSWWNITTEWQSEESYMWWAETDGDCRLLRCGPSGIEPILSTDTASQPFILFCTSDNRILTLGEDPYVNQTLTMRHPDGATEWTLYVTEALNEYLIRDPAWRYEDIAVLWPPSELMGGDLFMIGLATRHSLNGSAEETVFVSFKVGETLSCRELINQKRQTANRLVLQNIYVEAEAQAHAYLDELEDDCRITGPFEEAGQEDALRRLTAMELAVETSLLTTNPLIIGTAKAMSGAIAAGMGSVVVTEELGWLASAQHTWPVNSVVTALRYVLFSLNNLYQACVSAFSNNVHYYYLARGVDVAQSLALATNAEDNIKGIVNVVLGETAESIGQGYIENRAVPVLRRAHEDGVLDRGGMNDILVDGVQNARARCLSNEYTTDQYIDYTGLIATPEITRKNEETLGYIQSVVNTTEWLEFAVDWEIAIRAGVSSVATLTTCVGLPSACIVEALLAGVASATFRMIRYMQLAVHALDAVNLAIAGASGYSRLSEGLPSEFLDIKNHGFCSTPSSTLHGQENDSELHFSRACQSSSSWEEYLAIREIGHDSLMSVFGETKGGA